MLAGDYLAVGTDPFVLAALMGTGAIPTFIFYGVITDGLSLDFQPTGWIWIVGVAFVSLIAFTMFFAGLERVGPSLTGLLSTSEPVATTVASAVIFGASLTPVQGLGGALVIGAVVWVNLGRTRASRRARGGARDVLVELAADGVVERRPLVVRRPSRARSSPARSVASSPPRRSQRSKFSVDESSGR